MIGAALLCKIAGHRRGKRVTTTDGEHVKEVLLACPRCGATWTRPVKARAKGKAT